jgi:broad specificity phosphatase PhoE
MERAASCAMLAVSRSVLCLVAVSSWSLAAADPRPATSTDLKGGAVAPAGVKTIIVVRHAEAEATQPGGDPALTTDGRSRALELARVLGDTPLRSVFSTHYQRTRLTAEGLLRSGEKPIVIDDVPGTLKALRAEPWGATALVVGHSNTVPELIRGLTGHALPDGEPIVFDRIWIVTLAHDGAPSLLRLHYGSPVALGK